jgi:hypothetical protein
MNKESGPVGNGGTLSNSPRQTRQTRPDFKSFATKQTGRGRLPGLPPASNSKSATITWR